MSRVAMQLKEQCSSRRSVQRELILINDRIYIARRQIILPFKQKIKVGCADDIEGNLAERLMCFTRLRVTQKQNIGQTLDKAGPSKFMLVSRNRIQGAARNKIFQILFELFA